MVPHDGGPNGQVEDGRAELGVAAVASYEHAYDLMQAHGEAGWTARSMSR